MRHQALSSFISDKSVTEIYSSGIIVPMRTWSVGIIGASQWGSRPWLTEASERERDGFSSQRGTKTQNDGEEDEGEREGWRGETDTSCRCKQWPVPGMTLHEIRSAYSNVNECINTKEKKSPWPSDTMSSSIYIYVIGNVRCRFIK